MSIPLNLNGPFLFSIFSIQDETALAGLISSAEEEAREVLAAEAALQKAAKGKGAPTPTDGVATHAEGAVSLPMAALLAQYRFCENIWNIYNTKQAMLGDPARVLAEVPTSEADGLPWVEKYLPSTDQLELLLAGIRDSLVQALEREAYGRRKWGLPMNLL